MVSPFESDNVHIPELIATAARISRRGFGILAADESVPTAGKRLKTVGVENTAENRRAFRELLFTAEGLEDYISGVILFDETMYQRTAGGERFVDCLSRRGILVGTKLDTGLRMIAGTEGETRTGGLDGLGDRVCQYRKDGATFAKWRAVFKIGHAGVPSDRAIRENAQSLARYASICQEHGLVPIVEPELTLGPGDYSIGRAAFESERVLSHVMRAINEAQVVPEAMLLKPSMVLPGLDAPLGESARESVATHTAKVLKRTVPPAVPGVHFLSGGMGAEEATQNLQQLQHEYPDAPWSLSFSYGRALQDAVLKAWSGLEENVPAAQALLLELARVNAQAQLGEWDEVHPTPSSGGLSAGRILLPKLSYSSERPKTRAADLFNW